MAAAANENGVIKQRRQTYREGINEQKKKKKRRDSEENRIWHQ